MSANDDRLHPHASPSSDPAERDDRTPAVDQKIGKGSASTGRRDVSTRPYRAPWRKETLPYLKKLTERITNNGVKDHSISLLMGQYRVLLSPQEQQLMFTFSGNIEEYGAQECMLIDSLGLQIRMIASLRRLEKDNDLAAERHKKRLTRDRDFAYLLSREMTVSMRQVRESGDREATEALQTSRTYLHKAIVDVENLIGTTLSDAPSSGKNKQFVYDWNAIASHPDDIPMPTDPTPPSIDVKTGGQKSSSMDHTMRIRILLAASSLILLAVLLNLWNNRERQLLDFTVADFKEVPGIEQVVNRSPLLLIVVNESEWNRHNIYDKRKAVRAVGTIAKPAGYRKAEIRSTQTPYLAVWHRSGTIEISD